MTRLEKLLWERYHRLKELKSARADVANEDVIRAKQGWRVPWYNERSDENGYPARWLN